MSDSTTWVGMDVHKEKILTEEAQNPGIAPAVARLKTLRGVRTLTAMTILSELIDLSRFASPRELMSFIGLVPSEYASCGKQRRGSLTRYGNAHLRRVLVEAAWHYRHPPHRTLGRPSGSDAKGNLCGASWVPAGQPSTPACGWAALNYFRNI